MRVHYSPRARTWQFLLRFDWLFGDECHMILLCSLSSVGSCECKVNTWPVGSAERHCREWTGSTASAAADTWLFRCWQWEGNVLPYNNQFTSLLGRAGDLFKMSKKMFSTSWVPFLMLKQQSSVIYSICIMWQKFKCSTGFPRFLESPGISSKLSRTWKVRKWV